MLIFQGFANSRIVREFLPFSFKVRIATLTRNQFARKRTRVRIPSSPPKTRLSRSKSRKDFLAAFAFENMEGGTYELFEL